MYLILATEERIDYKYDNGIGNIVADYSSPESAAADIAKFTASSLKNVKFYDAEDNLLGEYTDLVFEGPFSEAIYDEETIVGYEYHFQLRQKSNIEKRLDTHDEEIIELQEAIIEL